MILKYSNDGTSNNWTFVGGITVVNTYTDFSQGKEDNFTLQVILFSKDIPDSMTLYFTKERGVYLLNEEGKTIESLN